MVFWKEEGQARGQAVRASSSSSQHVESCFKGCVLLFFYSYLAANETLSDSLISRKHNKAGGMVAGA